ncbi:MAG TPA: response regulator [Phototrophicaceae bacterium]|nr:response regulator [Phototrophicaceae bacterium]
MKKRVALVVEDNIELGYIYAAALEMADFSVEHIIDGKQALQRMEGKIPDLVVLDMNLPHVSGHFIYKNLRSDEKFTGMPVIIATANSLLAEALGPVMGPRDVLLIKPISPTQLRNIARGLFPPGPGDNKMGS